MEGYVFGFRPFLIIIGNDVNSLTSAIRGHLPTTFRKCWIIIIGTQTKKHKFHLSLGGLNWTFSDWFVDHLSGPGQHYLTSHYPGDHYPDHTRPWVFVLDNCHKGWQRSQWHKSQYCGDHDIVSPWDMRQKTESLHPIFGPPQFNCQQHLLIFEIWFLHALRSLLPLSRSKTFIFCFMIERKLVKGSIDWQEKSWC